MISQLGLAVITLFRLSFDYFSCDRFCLLTALCERSTATMKQTFQKIFVVTFLQYVRFISLLDLISVIMFSTRPDWQPCSEIVLVSFCQRFSFLFFLHVLLMRAYDLCKFWIAHMIVFRSFYRSIIPLLLLDYEAANMISWEVKPVDILHDSILACSLSGEKARTKRPSFQQKL